MKRFISAVILLLFVVSLAYLGTRFYQWRQDREKRRELFVYIQKKSEVTRRLPADAFAYLNLYQLKKIYSDLEGTRLKTVLGHWFDTGMSDKQKANPLLGGMLEKTVIDVLGDEFGIAIAPGSSGNVDYVAVAHTAPGSQFILRLALASAKHTRKISFNGETIYAFPTKETSHPEVFVYLNDDFAFSSSDLERLKQAALKKGNGPSFLEKLPVETLPSDMFLFLETKEPRVSMRGYGRSRRYHLQLFGTDQINSHLPDYQENERTVFQVQTNASEIWNQPALTYSMQSLDGGSASYLVLSFGDRGSARNYADAILNNVDIGQNIVPQTMSKNGIECHEFPNSETEETVCLSDFAVILARGHFDFRDINQQTKSVSSHWQPFIIRANLHSDRIREYSDKVGRQDWSRFSEAKAFYFLSCIRGLSGVIDGSNNELKLEVQ